MKRMIVLLIVGVAVAAIAAVFGVRRWEHEVERETAALQPPEVFRVRRMADWPSRYAGDVGHFARQSSVFPKLSAKGQAAFLALANAREWSAAFDDSRVEYPNTRAFNSLLYEAYGAEAFAELAESATIYGRLYGLCGLYFTDRDALVKAMPHFVGDNTPVETHFSDVVFPSPVSELVGEPPLLAPPVLSEPLEPMPALTVAAGGLCIAICRPPCSAAQQPNSALQPPDTPGTPPAKQASRQPAGG
jgi:hypothetical protein